MDTQRQPTRRHSLPIALMGLVVALPIALAVQPMVAGQVVARVGQPLTSHYGRIVAQAARQFCQRATIVLPHAQRRQFPTNAASRPLPRPTDLLAPASVCLESLIDLPPPSHV